MTRLSALPRADARDLHGRERLAVARLAAVVLSAAELEDDDLLLAVLGRDLRLYRGAGEERAADLHGRAIARAVAHEEDLAERDGVANSPRELLDRELVTWSDAILLAARLDHRVRRVHLALFGSRE